MAPRVVLPFELHAVLQCDIATCAGGIVALTVAFHVAEGDEAGAGFEDLRFFEAELGFELAFFEFEELGWMLNRAK